MPALYITHPQVVMDPRVPVPDWELSTWGRQRIEAAAAQPWARTLARVVTSEERKARETAAILAGAAGVEPEVWPDLGEVDRSATGYLPPAEHEAAADALFAEPDLSHRGWETARAAQARILGAVRTALRGEQPARLVAVVGHGGVGTLLRQALAGERIARSGDQPAGGGCLFAFRLPHGPPQTGWIAVEAWDGALPERSGND